MQQLFDLAAWREIFVRAFSEMGANVAGFLPSLVGALVILILGWLVSRATEVVARRLLRSIGIDAAASRLQLAALLERAEIGMTFSQILARLVFWLLMLTFVLSSVETLGLEAVTETIDRLIAFIPSVIGAALIGVAGLLLARLAGTLVSSGSAAAGFESAPRLGFVAQSLIAGLVLIIAVEQLGVATEVLVVPFSVLVGAAGLSAGLAFALGARPVITHILAGHFLKQSLPRDQAIEVEGRRGLVERIGATETVLRSGEQSFSVPNAQLLERIVVR